MSDHHDDNMITVISFLDHQEASEIKNILGALKINCIVSGHGTRGRGANAYYLVRVQQQDLATVKPIVNRFKDKMLVESMECPTCKSYAHTEVQKKGLWQMLFYLGTSLVECKKCKTRFAV